MSTTFPTLDTDLGDVPREQPEGVPKRICVATMDIIGPARNGGVGTASHHLTRLLVEWGHDVVIAYVNRKAADVDLMAEARARYSDLGAAFEAIIPRRHANQTPVARVAAPTWALLEWLRSCAEPFDLVHVPDLHGLGYGPLLAKSLGLAFGATHFVVTGHSPTLWLADGNRQLLSEEYELGWVFMERRSVELADTVICGSACLLEWMRDAGYALPDRAFVWPNVIPASEATSATTIPGCSPRASSDGEKARLEEVVFFGRLEPLKGLVLFTDAIDRLVRQGRAPARVTFLGRTSRMIDGTTFIQDRAQNWPIAVLSITDFDAYQAVAYLSQPGRLAVIPSRIENCSMAVLECLRDGIPFLAAATGGTPELVAPADHDRALVPPDHVALGERLAQLAAAPLRPVRPRWDFDRTRDVWSRWHAQAGPFDASTERFAARAQASEAETPVVTVCIVHHERPALVRMAVESVLAQDYLALDAVLVDDGSESPEACAAVDGIEAAFQARGWRVIRQENRYLGAARNAAAAAAQGEWLLFLDDDNVLFADAVSRLVRAALFSGADCVPAASIRFSGDGDPRADTAHDETSIRFLGAAAWNRVRNVAGGTCALVRRDVFEAAGGFAEADDLALDALELYNRFILAGRRVEPMPDPVFHQRAEATGRMNERRVAEASHAAVLGPHLVRLPADERAYAAYTGHLAAVQLHALKRRINTFEQTVRHRDRQIDALTQRIDRRNRRIDTLQNGLTQRDRHIDALRGKLRQREQRIDTIVQSTSWRITTPLRAIRSWMAGRPRP